MNTTPPAHLSDDFPHLAEQWSARNHERSLDDFSQGSKSVVWWKCDTGHEWEDSINHRTSGRNCPYCSGHRVWTGFNDLKTVNPDLAKQWHPTKNAGNSDSTSPGSNQKVWWLGECEHEWEATVKNRHSKNQGCPYCKGKLVLAGFNDLQSQHPSIASEWSTANELSVNEVYYKTSKIASWQCPQGHQWDASVLKRTVRGQGCPVCAGKRCSMETSISVTHPDLVSQWHVSNSLTPHEVSKGSMKNVKWICSFRHIWEAPVYARVAGNGCPRCAKSIQVSKNESLLADMLSQVTAVETGQIINGVEVDIYLPQKRFAIEFNGVYWHSEAAGRGKGYHQRKAKACQDAGVMLYQVWEDDWERNAAIILRGILHRIGEMQTLCSILPELDPLHFTKTPARKAKVHALNFAETTRFMIENHVQGTALGTHYLGLKNHSGDVVAALIIKRVGKFSPGRYSIERYATIGVVPGGFTKLLSYAEKNLNVRSWVTFADYSISDGGLYEANGFVAETMIPPDYSYLVSGKRVHKFNYRLARFRKDPELQWEEGLSERELALLNKLYRVWDSGKVRYVKQV